MTTAQAATTAQPYDNKGQYSSRSIRRYERIFGAGYISTGGPETTDDLCARLGAALRPGVRVLDVGSGIGGAAFHLARQYGAVVTGIDLAPEMVALARERASGANADGAVTFLLGDILQTPFATRFDIIWSRDALMHIPDKPRLFARLFDLTEPGGQLVITDYARGAGPVSQAFQDYVAQTGYHVTDPKSYGRLLEQAGYRDVVVEDATERFLAILKREAEQLAAHRDSFLNDFDETDLAYLIDRWAMKVRFCEAGDMKWGIYQATRS